jgi:phage repressor protein C with HTH and peptisase S24 domain
MSKASDEFAKRLNMAAKNKGLNTPADISKITGQNRITIGSYMRGERLASIEACIALAKALDVSPMWLHSGKSGGDVDKLMRGKKRASNLPENNNTEGTAQAAEPMHSPNNASQIYSGRLIPLYSCALAGQDDSIPFGPNVMENVFAPYQLANVADAYAVRVVGESMEPRYFPDEIVYVHPTMPVRKGDFVVAQISENGNEGSLQGFVKRFVSIDDTKLVLDQYIISKNIKFTRNQVKSVHKIIASSI